MSDRSDLLWRDDDPTPATKPARDDHAKDDQVRQVTERPGAPGHTRATADEPARDGEDRPQEPAGPREHPEWTQQTRTTGHRREHDARAHDPEARQRLRRSRTERTRDAVADVGLYRAVSYTDLSDQHFDGHPYVTRRSVNHLIRAGLIEEHEATGPQGQSFNVLTATERGRDAAQRAAVDAGHVPEQQTWSGMVKPAELSHDTAVYRAALDERARIEAEGGRVTRVRLDAELKQIVATATEKARAEGGDRAAHEAKLAAAHDLGLHVVNHDHVLYPDAQLDIEDADGVSGRVNVEIVSDHYHAAAIAAKAGAGFAMHGSSRSATRKIARALARETDSGPGGGEARAGRDGSVEL